MQKIKLIVTDIDGTLIADMGGSVAPVDLDAIKRAQDAGVKITIGTGRILGTAQRWVGVLGINGPVITCNGADIRDLNRSYFQDNIPLEDTKAIMEAYRDQGVKRYLFCDNNIYCAKEDYYQRLFDKWEQGEEGKVPVTIVKKEQELYEVIPGDVQKVLMWAPDDASRKRLWEIAEQFEGHYEIVRSDRDNIEFNKLGVTKGKAIRTLADYYGIQVEEVMCIGDGGNDVPMLRAAGVGVAMGNAMHEAIEAADFVTDDVRNGGVAKAIDRFVFGMGQ